MADRQRFDAITRELQHAKNRAGSTADSVWEYAQPLLRTTHERMAVRHMIEMKMGPIITEQRVGDAVI